MGIILSQAERAMVLAAAIRGLNGNARLWPETASTADYQRAAEIIAEMAVAQLDSIVHRLKEGRR